MRISILFPLGVYHAQSQASLDEPEWPPHPVRLLGALVAAAHSPGRTRTGGETLQRDLALLEKLCDTPPPLIGAPEAIALGEHTKGDQAVRIAGATRWAPRNYFTKGAREQAGVQKVGVALGDRAIYFEWPEFNLDPAEVERLASLVRDVSFLGTTRAPVVAELVHDASRGTVPRWTPVDSAQTRGLPTVAVRVPDSATLTSFDLRHDLRRSSKPQVESATAAVPGIRIGREVAYAHSSARNASDETIDPHWWGDMVVLAVDRDRSELIPRSAASYLLARAVRIALLSAYEEAGTANEAPPILRGRGDDPHCAIVPLADVWHDGARGEIKGVAVLLPSDQRTEGLPQQRDLLEQGLASLVRDTESATQRYVQIPDAGSIWLKLPGAGEAALRTLLKRTYRATATSWVSVTPVIHARWRKGTQETLADQVTRDCSHVGLPAPSSVEPIRGSAFPGAASRPVPTDRVPREWRKSLAGPSSHLRIIFPSPVAGPVLLGRARHFGLGLLVPEVSTRASASGDRQRDAT